MRYRLRTLIVVVALSGALIGLFGRVVTARYDHRHVVRNTFVQPPPDDYAMLGWIRSQPGITNCYVHRNGSEVTVGWMESRTLFEPEPHHPYVGDAFSQFRLQGSRW
jgi:hypothetical protein